MLRVLIGVGVAIGIGIERDEAREKDGKAGVQTRTAGPPSLPPAGMGGRAASRAAFATRRSSDTESKPFTYPFTFTYSYPFTFWMKPRSLREESSD